MIKPNLGKQIDALHSLTLRKKDAEQVVKLIEEDIKKAEEELVELMDKEGVTKSTGKVAAVSITESVVPQVNDWDQFWAYIGKNKYYHLLERRPSVTGCRELFETKGKIPGVVPFTKRRLTCKGL
jgi:hypothetical protein